MQLERHLTLHLEELASFAVTERGIRGTRIDYIKCIIRAYWDHYFCWFKGHNWRWGSEARSWSHEYSSGRRFFWGNKLGRGRCNRESARPQKIHLIARVVSFQELFNPGCSPCTNYTHPEAYQNSKSVFTPEHSLKRKLSPITAAIVMLTQKVGITKLFVFICGYKAYEYCLEAWRERKPWLTCVCLAVWRIIVAVQYGHTYAILYSLGITN